MFLDILVGFFIALIVLILALILLRKLTWLPNPYHSSILKDDEIPHFKEIKVDFIHQYHKDKSLPFMAGAVFDMRGDGIQYLFAGGGFNQADRLFVFKNDQFVDITEQSGLIKDPNDTTYGVAAIDVNHDGLIDLFIARQSGVYLYLNQNGHFVGKKLDIPFDEKSAPVSIAVADLLKRGLVDLFVCAYLKPEFVEGQTIFNKEGYGAKSLLLLNNGDNSFTDITKEAGLDYTHNTFQAVFVDLDGDGELDLVVAHDTGQVRTYKNMGNLKFQYMPNPTSDVYSYPMGIAVGDYNNDGRPDLFFSNVGPFYWWNAGATPPNLILRGDLKQDQDLLRTNIFLQNEGNFQLINIADQTKTADYEFGWGAVFQDFSNKGRLDLALAQNYIGFPAHWFLKLPCRLLMQLPDRTFASIEKEAGVENSYYAISPLLGDFNGNGFMDLVYTNLNGPLRVFLNQGSPHQFLKVVVKNEPVSLGATISVITGSDQILTSFFVPTQGLCTYQTNALIFGLGKEKTVKKVIVKFTNGQEKHFDYPTINSTIQV